MADKKLSRLRARIHATPMNARGRRRYSKRLRDDIRAYVADRRAQGASLSQPSGELGINSATLSNWASAEKDKAQPTKLVKAVELEVQSASTVGTKNLPTLELREGHRIEGLDIDQLVRLVKALS